MSDTPRRNDPPPFGLPPSRSRPSGVPPFGPGIPPRPGSPPRHPADPTPDAPGDGDGDGDADRANGAAPFPEHLQMGLFAQRTVFLRGALNDHAAGLVAAELMTHDGSGDEPITLIIDAAGGTLEAAFAIVDVIDLMGVPVHCTCIGRAHGPAAAVAAVCDRRRAAKHTQFRLCLPETAARGTARDLEQWRAHHEAQLERLCRRLADATGRAVEHVERDLHAGRYLDAEQARQYGLVDEVLERVAPIVSMPHLRGQGRFGFHPR